MKTQRGLYMRLCVVLSLALLQLCSALDPIYYAVKVTATATDVPRPTINITWPLEQCTLSYPCAGFTLYKRVYDQDSVTPNLEPYVPPLLVNLDNKTYFYVDNDVTVGPVYEYRIDRINVAPTTPMDAYTYLLSGIKVPMKDYNGVVILVIDYDISISLASSIQIMQQDLIGDGWSVNTIIVNKTQNVSQVKAKIAAAYAKDPANTKAVYVFGHVAVPYSYVGNPPPDGHHEHVGAWPADMYYGDVVDYLTTWTDSINFPNGTGRQMNRAGDGRFDQSRLPGLQELYVGRVDLSRMLQANETFLLSNYITKNHNFRNGITTFSRRAIVRDTFGEFNGLAFAANGYRAGNVFFGPTNVVTYNNNDVLAYTSVNDYLFFYGSGGGSSDSSNGVGTTNGYFTYQPKIVFTMQWGSFFGDWDQKDDFLRAPLAYGSGLTDVWGGGPDWQIHYLGMGLPIGRAAWENQNAWGAIHMALMGDPTLRMFVVAPPTSAAAVQSQNIVRLSWTASTDATVLGYYVYRAAGSIQSKFTKITRTLVPGTSFVDTAPLSGTSVYMVRAVKLEVSATGSYYNPSQGAFVSFTKVKPTPTPKPSLAPTLP